MKFKTNENELIWENYISPEDQYNDENNIVSYDELAETVANTPELLKKMGQYKLSSVDIQQNSERFLRFILANKMRIFSKFASLHSMMLPNPDALRLADDEIIKSDWSDARQDNDEWDSYE